MPTGRVVSWDDHRGYGTVRVDHTGADHFFHCTQIADGTRTIDEGTAVEFDIVPGRLGRWEAANIVKR